MWLIPDLQNCTHERVGACVLSQLFSLPGDQEVQGEEAGCSGTTKAAPNLEGMLFS